MILNVSFEEVKNAFNVGFAENNKTIKILFGENYNGKQYNGAYEVIPSRQEKILNTQGCYLSSNINIKQIPFAAVTNEQGGKTINIA